MCDIDRGCAQRDEDAVTVVVSEWVGWGDKRHASLPILEFMAPFID